jgi:hypothetical protein
MSPLNKDGLLIPSPSEPKLTGTERAIIKAIEKLSLKEGDILLVNDIDLAKAMSQLRTNVNFFVPIIIVPPGGITQLTIPEAKQALEHLITLETMQLSKEARDTDA